jgi:hypothetical protein
VPALEMERPDGASPTTGGTSGPNGGQHLETYYSDQIMARWSAHRSISLLLPNQIVVPKQTARTGRSAYGPFIFGVTLGYISPTLRFAMGVVLALIDAGISCTTTPVPVRRRPAGTRVRAGGLIRATVDIRWGPDRPPHTPPNSARAAMGLAPVRSIPGLTCPRRSPPRLCHSSPPKSVD